MSAAELARFVGAVGVLDLTASGVPFSVPVVVVDARKVFGRVDFLAEPVGGRGRAWVSGDRVRFSDVGGVA